MIEFATLQFSRGDCAACQSIYVLWSWSCRNYIRGLLTKHLLESGGLDFGVSIPVYG